MTRDARQKVLAACFKFLKPVTRFLLNSGISYSEFDQVCRQAFVRTASEEFGLRGRETNASRISAMTGIPRKQVRELRESTEFEGGQSEELLSPLADLIHTWSTHPDFVGESGTPCVLPLDSSGPGTFSELVRVSMGDMPVGAARTELLRLGAVTRTDQNQLRLTRRSLIPEDVASRLESAIVYSLYGLADTIARNSDPSTNAESRLFERFVESRPLSASEIAELRVQIRSRLSEIVTELDGILSSGSGTKNGEGKKRIGVGVFYSE